MSTEDTLKERRRTHGEYADHARMTQQTLRFWTNSPNWDALPDIMRESLHMFAHKVGRILTGNPFVHDHWKDISGYALLIVQRTEDGTRVIPFGAIPVEKGTECFVGEVVWATNENYTPPEDDLDLYLEAAKRWGCTRREAKDRILKFVYGSGAGFIRPGTPEDGGHHARQEDFHEAGERHDAVRRIARKFRVLMNVDQWRNTVRKFNAEKCRPPLSDAEVNSVMREFERTTMDDELRTRYPIGINDKEYDELPSDELRQMYRYNNERREWCMMEQHRDRWAREHDPHALDPEAGDDF